MEGSKLIRVLRESFRNKLTKGLAVGSDDALKITKE